MKLIEVNSKLEITQFLELPFAIYKNDPHWVPHIKQDIEKIFNPNKNKLFKEGGSAIRWILQSGTGEIIGRVAAFINPKTVTTTAFKTGGMGFFECIENEAAAFILFDACKNWLEQKGMEAMDGPVNFGDRQQFWGLQVSNFNHPPIYPMNYNPEYYTAYFERYGFGIYFNQYVYWRSVSQPVPEIVLRKYNQLKGDSAFEFSNIRKMSVNQVAENFRTVYNGAWGGHSHFKAMSSEAALKLIKSMKPAIDKDIIFFIFHQGNPIAFFVSLPELNQIFKYVKGSMNLIGKIKFLYHKIRKTPDIMTALVFGVVKEWQGKGLEAAIIIYGSSELNKKGVYKNIFLTWVGDFNPKMIKVVENLGVTLWRSFITYRYQFDRSLPFERAPIVDETPVKKQ